MGNQPASVEESDRQSMTERDVVAEKIPDDDLRAFAGSDSQEEREVVVELDLPEPQVEVSGVRLDNTALPVSRRVVERSSDTEQLIDAALAEAAKAVEETVGQPPIRLRYAHALVTVVTPAQLRKIAASDLTSVIRPNRELE
jgi:hypothetical protein